MGKPIDKNKPTKNMEDLLEHLNKPGGDLDAFEQEALEGFAMLDSKQEALNIKQRLDERMEEKFSEKRKPLFIYWSAAAGIALILGLIFLVRSNQDLKSEEVADNRVTTEGKLENTMNSPVAPPAELKQQEVLKENGVGGGKGTFGAESNAQMSKNAGPAQKMAEQQFKDAESEQTSVTLDETVTKDPGNSGEKNADNKRSDVTKTADDDLAKSGKKDQVPAAAAAGSGSNNNDGNVANEKAKSKEEEKRDEDKATGYFSRKIKKEKKAAEPAATANTDTKPKTETEGSFEKNNILSASLTIKEAELQQKIDKFFKDKDYRKSFICTLTIDADNKVESVVFQNPDFFSKSQRKDITDFFMKLTCFKNHEFSVYSTYKVDYKVQ